MAGNVLGAYLQDVAYTVANSEPTDLVTANLPLVVHIATRFRVGIPIDDLVASGNYALVNAVRTYHPQSGSFATYAGRAIRNELIKDLYKRTTVRPPTSRVTGGKPVMVMNRVGLDDMATLDASLMAVDDADEIEEIERRVSLRLDSRQQEIFTSLRHGATYQEIADKIGIDRGTVSHMVKKILGVLAADPKKCKTCGKILRGRGRTVYCRYECTPVAEVANKAVKRVKPVQQSVQPVQQPVQPVQPMVVHRFGVTPFAANRARRLRLGKAV